MDTYLQAARLCPFRQQLASRHDVASLPPDYAEMNAHKASACSSGLQQRHQSTSAGHPALVPRGLTPVDHFLIGGEVRSPIEQPVDVPSNLDFALAQWSENRRLMHGGKFSSTTCGTCVDPSKKQSTLGWTATDRSAREMCVPTLTGAD